MPISIPKPRKPVRTTSDAAVTNSACPASLFRLIAPSQHPPFAHTRSTALNQRAFPLGHTPSRGFLVESLHALPNSNHPSIARGTRPIRLTPKEIQNCAPTFSLARFARTEGSGSPQLSSELLPSPQSLVD